MHKNEGYELKALPSFGKKILFKRKYKTEAHLSTSDKV